MGNTAGLVQVWQQQGVELVRSTAEAETAAAIASATAAAAISDAAVIGIINGKDDACRASHDSMCDVFTKRL